AQQDRRQEEHAGVPQWQDRHDAPRCEAGRRHERCRERIVAQGSLREWVTSGRRALAPPVSSGFGGLGDLLAGGDVRPAPTLLGERPPTHLDRGTLGDGPVSLAWLCPQGRLLPVIGVLGCLTGREVTRGSQVARQEVLSYGALGLLGDVDLPLP